MWYIDSFVQGRASRPWEQVKSKSTEDDAMDVGALYGTSAKKGKGKGKDCNAKNAK